MLSSKPRSRKDIEKSRPYRSKRSEILDGTDTMPDQVPHFDDEAIASLAMELYGIEGEISPLDSYEDQNARIKTSDGSYVLKIANTRWAIEGLQMQAEVLKHLENVAPELSLPRSIPTKNGDDITLVDGFAVRLLNFIDGDIIGNAARSPELYFNLGAFIGRFTLAMQGYSHPAAHRPDDLWNLDNVIACKAHLRDVADEDVRARIERFYESYERNVQPGIRYFRKSVIHNDPNEQNLLVAVDAPTKISGLIDFGDINYGATVNDLAITLAYNLLGEEDTKSAALKIIQGYVQEFPLEADELEVLFDLVAMRLVQSLIMTSNRAKEVPDNAYILVSQKPAKVLLKKLEGGILL